MNSKNNNIELSLSIKPEEESIISNTKKQLIEEDLNSLPPIEENIVNISTVYVFDIGEKIEASIFIRNGLKSKLNIETIKLNLVNEKNEFVKCQEFDLKGIGNIPPKSARPWKIYFDKSDMDKLPLNFDGYSVIFNETVKVMSTVETKLEDDYEDVLLKKSIEDFLLSLPFVRTGQVDANLYNIRIENEEKIILTIMFRNGNDKKISINNIEMSIFIEDKVIMDSACVKLKNLQIGAKKAKLYNIIFNFHKDKYSNLDMENILVNLKGVNYSEI